MKKLITLTTFFVILISATFAAAQDNATFAQQNGYTIGEPDNDTDAPTDGVDPDEANLICGGDAWIAIWDEDENGDKIEGTLDFECLPDERQTTGRGSAALNLSLTGRDHQQQGNPGGGPVTELELDLTCGDDAWIVIWEEDADGNPIPGTHDYDCV